eukprot:COSAG02_NODE_3710_length_6342_cov_30.226494_3_plen_95_part_00
MAMCGTVSEGTEDPPEEVDDCKMPAMFVGRFRVSRDEDGDYSRPSATGQARFFHRNGTEALIGMCHDGHLCGEVALFLADSTSISKTCRSGAEF